MRARLLFAGVVAPALFMGLVNVTAAKPAAAKCLDSAGCVSIGPGAPVRIGTLVISDLAAPVGKESARAIELAVDLRGVEVAGHPIQLTHFGDGCDAGLAATTADAIAVDPALVAVLGTTCSNAAFDVAPVLGAAGITMISPSNTHAVLTDSSIRDPFYFRTAYNDGLKAEALAEFLFAEGHDTAAFVVVDSLGTNSMAADFAARFTTLGGTVTNEFTVDDGDFTDELAATAGSSPDVVLFLFFDSVQTAEFVMQARSSLDSGTVLVSTDDSTNQAMLDELNKAGALADADGIVLSVPDFSFLTVEPYLGELLDPYETAFGGPPTAPYHGYAFDAVNRLLDVVQTFQTGGSQQLLIPRTGLRDAFAATNAYAGVTGSITCDLTGDCNPNEFVIRTVSGGEIVDVP